MRIAIVGSGIAGLTAAWLLRRGGHEVTLLEKHQCLGLDHHSIDVPLGDGSLRVDIPSRMFSHQLWPNLMQLYDEIEVDYTPVDTSQSFSRLGQDCFLNIDRAQKPKLRPKQLLSKTVRQIMDDISRLQEQGRADLGDRLSLDVGFGEYLKNAGYSQTFIFDFLFPTLSSTVCTCSYHSLAQYPARIILHTLQNLMDSERLLRTKLGTGHVANRLASGIDDIRLNTSVIDAHQAGDHVEFRTSSSVETFDHLVIATQANAAIAILPQLCSEEREMLESFSYEDIPVAIHNDESLMPPKRKHWSTFNMISTDSGKHTARGASMCSIWMNRFNDELAAAQPLFQTTSPIRDPDPAKTICVRQMQRPVINQRSLEGLHTLTRLHEEPHRRIWFCGSYASPGVSLLESGVVSSMHVVNELGTAAPWQTAIP